MLMKVSALLAVTAILLGEALAGVLPGSTFSNFRYLNNNTEKYRVESLPDVHFNLGEIYSGNIAINESDPSRSLFFVYQPTIGEATDELVVWLNGGPGCSSLVGFFQENGRWTWQPGTYLPVENPYSWVNLTNMLWVDQPVGAGFSNGPITATSQEETAQDFIKFFKNFEEIFGIKNYQIYVAGESYAGRYVPYISAAMLDEKDKEFYNLSGALVYDPNIGDALTTQNLVPFLNTNANVFNLNASMMASMNSLDKFCGFEAYRQKYLAFPPPGNQPDLATTYDNATIDECNIFGPINDAALAVNPCFSLFEITQQCPQPWDVLGVTSDPSYYAPNPSPVYFNRTDVKRAMHAPLNQDWAACSAQGVGSDDSAPPIERVLPQVIEATGRVLVGNGDLDMILITNGTLLSIQNMTWHGQLGFQQRPATPIFVEQGDLQYHNSSSLADGGGGRGGGGGGGGGADGADGDGDGAGSGSDSGSAPPAPPAPPQGTMGIQHYERGLMWAETFLSGHMQPEFQPRVSYRHLQWLLRRTDHL